MTSMKQKDWGFCSRCRVALVNETTDQHYLRVHPKSRVAARIRKTQERK